MRPADRPTLPRHLHPVAWWVWAVCLATAASRTTNPLVLALVVAVAAYVVASRRESGTPPVFAAFLWLGLSMVVVRVLVQLVLGSGVGGRTVLLELPQVPLPGPLEGVRIGGPVTGEEVAYAAYEGARLAAVLACVGAANALASPRRLLRHVPATLYEVGTALVVAMTYAPQLVDDARRVRSARRLRGRPGRSPRELARVAVPVLEGALERSLDLAAAMESRGYGRSVHRDARERRLAGALGVAGVTGVVVGVYGLLDGGSPPALGVPLVVAGGAACAVALWRGARRDPRSRYRPDPWALPEWGVVASGLVTAVAVLASAQLGLPGLVPPTSPLGVPAVPSAVVLAVGVAVLPAWLAPVPPRRASLRPARRDAQPLAAGGRRGELS
ncbi:MAG: energy-coupling factor transporter transmembrane component T [Actinomycetes bacterium]